MTIPLIQTVQDWQALSPRWGLLTLALGLFSLAGSVATATRRYRRVLLLSGLVLVLGGFLPILLLLLPLVIGYLLSSAKRSSDPYYHNDKHPFIVDRGGIDTDIKKPHWR